MPRSLSVEDFHGAVSVKNAIIMEDGRSYWTFIGKVSVLDGKATVGFDIENRDANWFARVESDDGGKSVNILGCQIQAIFQGWASDAGAGCYRL